MRGQRDTSKGKDVPMWGKPYDNLQKQADAIIHQVQEQAQAIKAEATEIWDSIVAQ